MPKTDATPANSLRCARNQVRSPWNKLEYVSLVSSKTVRCRSRRVGEEKPVGRWRLNALCMASWNTWKGPSHNNYESRQC
jgi:hypothetical protein